MKGKARNLKEQEIAKLMLRRSKALVVILLLVGMGAFSGASAAQACYSLQRVVDGGLGDAPLVVTPANCPDGRFRTNTRVILRASPAGGSLVYAWRGTDDELSTALTNTVTMTGDKVVGIHYILDGDPNLPVEPGRAGGIAREDARVGIPEVVIGIDDRIQVMDTETPTYRKNAYLALFFDDGDQVKDSQCTGWFVGPYALITAGHCLYSSDYPGDGWVIDVSVVPARNGESMPYGHAHAAGWQSVSGWVDSGLDAYDYGVIQLGPEDDLGNQVGWYRYGYYSDAFLSGLTATIAGYPGEKPLGTMWVDGDPITGVTSSFLHYTIDTSPGTSGSAVWFPSDSDVALAIHTRGLPAAYNYGPRITQDLAETIQAWGAATEPLTDCPALGIPGNSSPAPGSILADASVLFDWIEVADSSAYQLQVWQADLSETLVDEWVEDSSHSATLPEGIFNWRVMAYTDMAGCPDGEWSGFWSVTVDTQPPEVVVISPNDGEAWVQGSVHDITWAASDNRAVTNIALYYSADGGSSWNLIDATEANDGSYAWTVPNDVTSQARVRVQAYDAAGHTSQDASDADFSITSSATTGKKTFRSNAGNDGWVRESSEESGRGGTRNNTSMYLYAGDDASDRQYRTILSFNTGLLPDNASITRAVLKLKLHSITGTSPFNTHNGLKVDIRQPFFSTTPDLQISDFQAAACLTSGATVRSFSSGTWYSAVFQSNAFACINKTGTTQLRLRFAVQDNDDLSADFLSFFSGNAYSTYRPILLVEYLVP